MGQSHLLAISGWLFSGNFKIRKIGGVIGPQKRPKTKKIMKNSLEPTGLKLGTVFFLFVAPATIQIRTSLTRPLLEHRPLIGLRPLIYK